MSSFLQYRTKTRSRQLPSGSWSSYTDYSSGQQLACGYSHVGNRTFPPPYDNYEYEYITEVSLIAPLPACDFEFNVVENGITLFTLNQDSTFPFTSSPYRVLQGEPFSITLVCYNCTDNSDCPKGEKCVDGECVPCEKLVDGKGIVTLWGVKSSDGSILTDGLSVDISSGVGSVLLEQFDPYLLRSGRIQILNGMKGHLTIKAGIGFLGSNFGTTIDLFSGSVDGFYQDFIFDSGKLPFLYFFTGHVFFEILNYDTLGDCADDVDDDTPDDPPDDQLPPDDDDLDDIIDDPGDEEDDSGGGGSEPPEPELCECEKYIGKQIARASNAITSAGNAIKGQIYLSGESIRKEINQQTSISREFVLFSKNQLLQALTMIYSELRSMRVDLSSIRGEVESLDDNIKKGLILPQCGSEPEKGIVQVFDEFSQKYEPVDVVVEEADVWQHSPDEAPRNYPRKL